MGTRRVLYLLEGPPPTRQSSLIVAIHVRTISLRRARGAPLGTVTDPRVRRAVRLALAHHLGLDIAAISDGART